MSVARRAIGASGALLGAAISLGPRAGRTAASLAGGPRYVVARIDLALANLVTIAGGVEAMNREFVGMRADILVLDEHVTGLRAGIEQVALELGQLRGEIVQPIQDVTPMRASVGRLEERVQHLHGQLEAVERLALRFGRFGRARARARVPEGEGDAPLPVEPPDEAAAAAPDEVEGTIESLPEGDSEPRYSK